RSGVGGRRRRRPLPRNSRGSGERALRRPEAGGLHDRCGARRRRGRRSCVAAMATVTGTTATMQATAAGVGVVGITADGFFAVGLRREPLGKVWSLPGGRLEPGESFEDCA